MQNEVRSSSFAITLTILFTAIVAVAYGFGVYLFASLMPDMRKALGLDYASIGSLGAARQIAFLATALATPAIVLRLGAGLVILGPCSPADCHCAGLRSRTAYGRLLASWWS